MHIVPLGLAAWFLIPPIIAVTSEFERQCLSQLPSLSSNEFIDMSAGVASLSSLPSLADLEKLLGMHENESQMNGGIQPNWSQCAGHFIERAKDGAPSNPVEAPGIGAPGRVTDHENENRGIKRENEKDATLMESEKRGANAFLNADLLNTFDYDSPRPSRSARSQQRGESSDSDEYSPNPNPSPNAKRDREPRKSSVRGVSYCNGQWSARVYIDGREIHKSFSVSKYGNLEAMRMAERYKLSNPNVKTARVRKHNPKYQKFNTTSNTPGVFFHRGSWLSRRSFNMKTVQRNFGVDKHGFEKAKQMAIAFRKELENDDYFNSLPGSHRKRPEREIRVPSAIDYDSQLQSTRQEIAKTFRKRYGVVIPPDDFGSNVSGVRFTGTSWDSVVGSGNSLSRKSFSIGDYGFYAAKQLAEQNQQSSNANTN